MTQNDYIKSLDFFTNPFQHTNADKEVDFLSNYFIKPDYFEDIWGDPYNPVPSIVYAPRGSGKTAQRIMIEKRAKEYTDILTISYTNHDLSEFNNINEINQSYHLTYINRLLLVAFFKKIDDNTIDFKNQFSKQERKHLFDLTEIYLYDTPTSFPNQAIQSLKTFSDKGLDIWNRFKEPIINIIKKISEKAGVEVDLNNSINTKLKYSHKDNFTNIINYLTIAGYNSIFILIDKVDEQNLTGNNAENSFKLIEHLITDLELLETPRVSFKFFLWDELKPYIVKIGRPDRIFPYDLQWDWNQIENMLDKRIMTYSNNQNKKFVNYFDYKKLLGQVILFSSFSPRDAIRICNRIISEQFKNDSSKIIFKQPVVHESIKLFCKEKSKELIINPNNLNHLTKLNKVSFTIEELTNSKFAASSAAVRNIINPWQNAGYIKRVGIQNRKNQKPVNIYAFQNIVLAYSATPKLTIQEFIDNKVTMCKHNNCKQLQIREFDKQTFACQECGTVNK